MVTSMFKLYTATLAPLFFLSILTFFSPLLTAEALPDSNAVLIHQPKYGLIRNEYEGWVNVGFDIDEHGVVVNPVILDSTGYLFLERTALTRIKARQYKPAVRNGKPVAQTGNEELFQFYQSRSGHRSHDKHTYTRTIDRGYARQYERVLTAVKEQDLTSAKAHFEKLQDPEKYPRLTLTVDSLYWQARGEVYGLEGNEHEQLKSFRRALVSPHEKLVESVLTVALQKLFRVEFQMGRFADAKKTWQLIKQQDDNAAAIEQLGPYVEKIDQHIASERLIVVPAMVNEKGYFKHQLVRRSFELHDVKGTLRKVAIGCTNKRAMIDYSPDNALTIPKSWGDCTIKLYGEQNTTLNLVEFAQSS